MLEIIREGARAVRLKGRLDATQSETAFAEFDTDQELMTLLMGGDFGSSRIGQYLHSLRSHFEGPIVADMLCLIRIRVELSILAKGMLMMQEAGFVPPPDESIKAKFAELDYLEDSIGRAGMMAIEPIQQWSNKELWQLNML